MGVCLCIDLNSEILKILADCCSVSALVLTDTCGEYDSINTAESCYITADILGDLIAEDLVGQLCALVAFLCCLCDVTVIGGNTGNTKHTGLLVEKIGHLLGSKAFLLSDEGYNRRIESTGTGTHHEAVQRSQTHAGINALTVLDSSDGRTVAKMAGDDLCAFRILCSAEKLKAACGNISVACAVCAVAAYLIFFIIFPGNRENICLGGHGAVEGSIEYDDLGSVLTEGVDGSSDTLNVCRIVERCKRAQLCNVLYDLLIYKAAFAKDSAALNYTVTDCGNLCKIIDDLALALSESLLDKCECLSVVAAFLLYLKASAVGKLMSDKGSADSYTLAVALCKYGLIVHIDELILKRAAACIDYENFHCDLLLVIDFANCYYDSTVFCFFQVIIAFLSILLSFLEGNVHMKVAGVVAEYNPFHKGHEYQLERTRSDFGATHIAVCMSGSFTQRGDCACLSKFARAKAAVQCGADLVLELSLPWAVSPAGRFAAGSVNIFDALGCVDMLSFGSECGDTEQLLKTVNAVRSLDDRLFDSVRGGGSLAAARYELVAAEYGEETASPLKNPNDTLAVEYMLASSKLCKPIPCYAVERTGAGHDCGEISCGFASASLLRTMLSGDGWQDFVPDASREIITEEIKEGHAPADINRLGTAVLAKLRTLTASDYVNLFEVSEGLENRIVNAVRSASSLTELYDTIKTKRYSHSRIRRIILSAFLGVNREMTAGLPPYIRILAMNERGREIISAARPILPIVARYADTKNLPEYAQKIFELECRATDLWALSLPSPAPCGIDCTSKLIVM